MDPAKVKWPAKLIRDLRMCAGSAIVEANPSLLNFKRFHCIVPNTMDGASIQGQLRRYSGLKGGAESNASMRTRNTNQTEKEKVGIHIRMEEESQGYSHMTDRARPCVKLWKLPDQYPLNEFLQ